MKKWNLIVDVANCTNCNACVLACHDEYCGNDFPGYAAEMPKHGHKWINIEQKVRGSGSLMDVAYLPVMCQHCEDAPCIEAAENGAVTKRPDGIVIIDPVKSKGQKQIMEACPYDAVWWNEEKDIPQAWIFDAHLLDEGWTEPRAAQMCATQAIRAVKADDGEMNAIVADENLEHLHPKHGTKPRVWYKNLQRYNTAFIAGSVETENDGVVDCLEGAAVTLSRSGETLQEAVSDIYGDFKFDGLEENSNGYRLEIRDGQGREKTIELDLTDSIYMGSIPL